LARGAATAAPERWSPRRRRRRRTESGLQAASSLPPADGQRGASTQRRLPADGRYPSGRMRRTKALLLAAVFVASCSTPKGSDARRYLPTSGPLPDVQGTSLSGGSVTPDQYRGKVVLLNFWNQDCPPCREEMPVLETAWETLRTQGLYVI